jgi:hypothetical protein
MRHKKTGLMPGFFYARLNLENTVDRFEPAGNPDLSGML